MSAKQISRLIVASIGMLSLTGSAGAALTHAWLFEEPSGSTALDTVGTNPGTLVDNTFRSTDTPWFTSTRSLSFDGAGDRVDIAATPRIQIGSTSNFTIAAWYKGTATGGPGYGRGLVGSMDGNALYAQLGLLNNRAVFAHYDGVGWQTNILSTSVINDNDWHHIAVVNYSNQTADLYIDGTREVTGASSVIQSGFFFTIDQFMGTYFNQYTSGMLDEVNLFNHALTESEVDVLVPEPASASVLAAALFALTLRRVRGRRSA